MDSATTTVSEVCRKYLRLQRAENVGPIRCKALLEHFGSVDAILAASMAELQRVEGVGEATAQGIFKSRGDDAIVEHEVGRAAELGVQIFCLEDAPYPASLKHIPDPPICIYVRGTIEPADAVSVAIVGTRRCSHYGTEQALRFGEALAGAGFTVVSGLARGVDGHAHRGALRAGGRTIAILGNGLSSIYPPEHVELAERIAQSGAVISELPIDTGPEPKNFPGRNRIIIGLSLGVLVIEAGKRSGALITARLANEYNREVFALPGRVDHPDQTAGSNSLIRDQHAKLVTCLEDILDELGEVGTIMRPEASEALPASAPANSNASAGANELSPVKEVAPSLGANEQVIYAVIKEGVEDIDSIGIRAGIESGQLNAALTALQLKGMVKQLPGNRFTPRSQRPVS